MNGSIVLVCTGGIWQSINGEEIYVRDIVNNFGICLKEEDFKYEILVNMVTKRICIGDNQHLLLSFKHPDEGYVMNIENDSDVCMLKWVIDNSKKTVHLYSVVSVPQEHVLAIPSSGKGSNSGAGCSGTRVKRSNLLKTDDEGWSEDEFTHQTMGSNPFYFMPPIPPSSVKIFEPGSCHSFGVSDKMSYLQTYKNKDALISSCKMKAIREKFQFKTKKSNPQRYEIVCLGEGCPWRLYATSMQSGDTFKIKKFHDEHNCTSTVLHPNHKQASTNMVGTIVHDMMGKDHSRKYKPKEIVSDMNTLFEVNVTYKKAWHARNYAFQLMTGSAKESFAQLPNYFYHLKKYNPGTVTFIDTDSEDQFEQCFFAFGCAIRAFKTCLRQVIIMDGAHLKGKFEGTVLHAVAMDGDNQIFPVGYGICKKESTSTWTWFLQKLQESLGECDNLTFVTDRAQSIAVSIENVYPDSLHVICGWHLLQNVYKHAKRKSDKTRDFFWSLAKAFTPSEFEEIWDRFSRVRQVEAAYLQSVPCEKWTRTYCPRVMYDFLTSNSAESINALSVDARKQPIVALIEWFRRTRQRWFYERSREAGKLNTLLTTWAEGKVKEHKNLTNGWTVCGISECKYQVHDFNSGAIIDLIERTCSCRVWQLTGIPCGHVSKVLTSLGKESCAHMAIKEYKIDTYRRTYEECVYPVPEPRDWEVPDDIMIVRPPVMETRRAGRPKNKKRFPSQGEEPTPKYCTRCDKPGHTCRSCTEYAPINKTRSITKRSTRKSRGASGSTTQETQEEGYCGTVDLNN